ncbi:MAG: hypothetical protein R3348_08085 [Xanthomonadales bacterium]|nr:hypothetical protein [Xanthomonadales bacterium]
MTEFYSAAIVYLEEKRRFDARVVGVLDEKRLLDRKCTVGGAERRERPGRGQAL